MNEFRVLVCGGRDYGWEIRDDGTKVLNFREVSKLYHTLADLKRCTDRPIVIIHGGARGADRLAGEFVKFCRQKGDNTITELVFAISKDDWNRYGKRAGFVRNKQMLDQGVPDLVIGFPGGAGTNMMCTIAGDAGVPVKRIAG